MRRFNPEPPRCSFCDARCRNQADLIAHEMEHRGSAEDMATRLADAAAAGLEADVERGVVQPHRRH